jgi:hypothetical protein
MTHAMNQLDEDELKEILSNPAISAEHKELLLQQLGELSRDPLTRLEADLLQAAAAPDLAAVAYLDVHAYCTQRGWKHTHPLFDRWRDAHWKTEAGQKNLERIADYLRRNYFAEWEQAMGDWKHFEFKSAERLISVLERIVDSPNRGNYHDPETVEGATLFLTELRRRAGQVQATGQVSEAQEVTGQAAGQAAQS